MSTHPVFVEQAAKGNRMTYPSSFILFSERIGRELRHYLKSPIRLEYAQKLPDPVVTMEAIIRHTLAGEPLYGELRVWRGDFPGGYTAEAVVGAYGALDLAFQNWDEHTATSGPIYLGPALEKVGGPGTAGLRSEAYLSPEDARQPPEVTRRGKSWFLPLIQGDRAV